MANKVEMMRVYRSVSGYTVAALKAAIEEIDAADYGSLPNIDGYMKARSAELKVALARIEEDMF